MADRNELTLPATCRLHGTDGFTNLRVRLRNGGVVFDPHVDGSCVVTLYGEQIHALAAKLQDWLPPSSL